ncbi:MAG: toll/interleukin-1 receptor domain-containing protein [Woeseiaceae bacterium]|nr:toll/interleukin-1 receptor domain-containing protein [Woeseiaceae bacterium]
MVAFFGHPRDQDLSTEYKYRAFISYSHKDEKWASWLHRSLETFRVPKNIVGMETPMGTVPERLGKVFRDRDELASSSSLGDELTQALRDSACQIVICSPHAANSHWTNEEILTYKRLGRENRVFCLIVDGEPYASQFEETAEFECFPNALMYQMGEDGNLTERRAEPIAADARPHGDGKQNAKLKLISGMLGVGFDDLKQREQQRRQRRMALITAAATVGMVITTGLAALALIARNEAEYQRNQAEIEAETARQTTQFMVGLFEVSDPSESLGNSITAREILDKGAERIETELEDQPEIQATLMDTMGTVYTSLGLYDPAVSLVSQALERRAALFGRKHPEVLASLNHLGEVQTLQADYEQAAKNLGEALAARREIFGDENAEVANTLSDLAEVLTLQGDFVEAEKLIRESLNIRRALYGTAHDEIAESLEALGLNMYDQGNLEGAIEELNSSVAMRRELHGDLHPELAAAVGNLALVLADLGQLEEAENLYQEALTMQRKLHGDAHPEVAFALNNIGTVRQQRNDLAGAQAAFSESLEILRELLGDSHPRVATTMSNIALVLYDRGDVAGAIDMARQTLEMRRDVLGARHPEVSSSAVVLAIWLTETGAYEEAEVLIDEAISIREDTLNDDHPRLALARVVKANLLIATDRHREALALAQQVRSGLLQGFAEDHWLVAYASSAEGAALVQLGSYTEAEPLLLASMEPLELALIPGAAKQHRLRLADLYAGLGRPGEEAKYRTAN